jgi:alkaline phosphatase D
VVLASDTHNAWANDLQDAQGNRIGVEFATPSVSLPGIEAVFTNENPVQFAAVLEALIGPLAYTDTRRCGALLLTLSRTEARYEYRYVSTIASKTYSAAAGRTMRMLPDAANRKLQAV